jgi:VIT1/CCC1 family predicted Fe2+/Mn2+ transporter
MANRSDKTPRSREDASPALRLWTASPAENAQRVRHAHVERHRSHVGGWLRASVLGANDGIVSTASLVLGVAAAQASPRAILAAGLAGLVGGSLSMAAGEYVSVSSQRDVEQADLVTERRELAESPEGERDELMQIYMGKGLPEALARQVADAMMASGDPLAVHAREELKLDPNDLARPVQAALVSAVSFAFGAALPLALIVLSPTALRVPFTLAAAVIALALLGGLSAKLGRVRIARVLVRVIVGGLLAMGLTYGLGALFGASG